MSYDATSHTRAERRQREQEELIGRMKQAAGAGGAGAGTGTSAPPPPDTDNLYDHYADSTEANLRQALRVSAQTHASGQASVAALGRQRETIQRATEGVAGTESHLLAAGQTTREMQWAIYKEWLVKGAIVGLLLLLIMIVFYRKVIR